MRSEYQKQLMLVNVVGTCRLASRDASREFTIGNFGLEQLPVILPVTKPQSQPAALYLMMDLDAHMLRRIEELRDGDILLKIVLYAFWVAVDATTGSIAEPVVEAQNVTDRDQSQTIRIPQTDWLKILEGLKYGKFTVFEIETPVPPLDDVLVEAIKHLSQATRLFNEGNYEESMVRCRRAIESAVDRLEAKSGRQLSDLLASGSRTEFIRGLASKTKEFLAPAAHGTEEPRAPEPKNREDARLANVMSYAVISYLASFISRK
jgi:hypothetical protein